MEQRVPGTLSIPRIYRAMKPESLRKSRDDLNRALREAIRALEEKDISRNDMAKACDVSRNIFDQIMSNPKSILHADTHEAFEALCMLNGVFCLHERTLGDHLVIEPPQAELNGDTADEEQRIHEHSVYGRKLFQENRLDEADTHFSRVITSAMQARMEIRAKRGRRSLYPTAGSFAVCESQSAYRTK